MEVDHKLNKFSLITQLFVARNSSPVQNGKHETTFLPIPSLGDSFDTSLLCLSSLSKNVNRGTIITTHSSHSQLLIDRGRILGPAA